MVSRLIRPAFITWRVTKLFTGTEVFVTPIILSLTNLRDPVVIPGSADVLSCLVLDRSQNEEQVGKDAETLSRTDHSAHHVSTHCASYATRMASRSVPRRQTSFAAHRSKLEHYLGIE